MIRKADCPLYRKLRKFWSSDEQSLKQSNESGRLQRPVMSMKRSEFRARLNRYVNGAIFSTSDQVRSLFSAVVLQYLKKLAHQLLAVV